MTSGFSEWANMCFSFFDENCFYPYFHKFKSNKIHQKRIEMYPVKCPVLGVSPRYVLPISLC